MSNKIYIELTALKGFFMSKVITAAKQAWSAKDQITRNIWLAGLGAYDKGYESASNTMTKSHSIFDELVERGRKLEADTTKTISFQKDKLASASQNATNALQGKVQSAVSNLTHIDANTFDNIIDKIEQNIIIVLITLLCLYLCFTFLVLTGSFKNIYTIGFK